MAEFKPLEHTLDSFINDPSSDKTYSILSFVKKFIPVFKKGTIRKHEESYHNLIQIHKTFKTRIIKLKDSVLFNIKIPSESNSTVVYDVCIEFLDTDLTETDIKDKKIRFFGNAPSFTFFYAYVYNKHNMLIPMLRNKLPSQALTQEPTIRNPSFEVGYEKYITIAILHILSKKLHLKEVYKHHILPASITPIKLFRDIHTADDIVVIISKSKKLATATRKANKNAGISNSKEIRVTMPDGTVKVTKLERKTNKIHKIDTLTGKSKTVYQKKTNNQINTKVDNKVNNKINTKIDRKVK